MIPRPRGWHGPDTTDVRDTDPSWYLTDDETATTTAPTAPLPRLTPAWETYLRAEGLADDTVTWQAINRALAADALTHKNARVVVGHQAGDRRPNGGATK